MRYPVTSAILFFAATTAQAQGFSGASIDATYLQFPDIEKIDSTAFTAGLDFDLVAGFGLGAGIARRDQSTDAQSAEITGYTLHGIYTVDSGTKVGVFAARENVSQPENNLEITTYGLQSAFIVGPVTGQAHIGQGEVTGDASDLVSDVTYYGVAAAFGFGTGLSLTGAGNVARIDEDFRRLDVSTIEVGAKFALTRSFDIAATFGQIKVDTGFDETQDEKFAGLSATFAFGPQGGATFDSRGLYQILKIGF